MARQNQTQVNITVSEHSGISAMLDAIRAQHPEPFTPGASTVARVLMEERAELFHAGWKPGDADTMILLKAIVGLSDHDRQALLLWLSENAARAAIDSSSISEKGILSKRRTNG